MSYQDPTQMNPSGKKKIVRRTKTDDSAGDPTPSSAGPIPTQIVNGVDESNALVSRLKQLESESSTLARTLTKVCDENARLSKENLVMQEKITTLASTPFAGTSVLHSLFEPEKTGWFGGSKSAAKDQVQKLCEALQNEFLEYKTTHTASEEEVLALVTAVQDTTMNNQEMSKIIQSLQDRLSNGPETIQVRILPVEDVKSQVAIDEIKSQLFREQSKFSELNDKLIETSHQLQAKCAETIQLQNEIKTLRDQVSSNTSSYTPLKTANVENDRLQSDMTSLREALSTQEKLNAMKTEECNALTKRLESIKSAHDEEIEKMRHELRNNSTSAADCTTCARNKEDMAKLEKELAQSRSEVQSLRSQLLDTTTKSEKNYAALEAKLVECQKDLSMKESAASRAVSSDDFRRIGLEKATLEHEVALCKDRIKYLEEMNAKHRAGESAVGEDLDTTQILQTLSKNKEKITKLEFELQQAQLQLKQAQAYAVSRDEDAKRLERTTVEDKQRVAFLLKKCAAATADSRAAIAGKDAAVEQLEQQKSDNKKLTRQLEELADLRVKVDQLSKEKRQLEERISSAEELEEKLVKAKETIAYMELAQSKTINMSQYAELQASRDKLENSVAPLKKQLDEANKEITRLKSITEAQHTVSMTQKNSVQGWQDKVDQLSESESKLREQNTTLVAENERLKKLNESLESQMSDMQDGIKEMAIKMEENRSSAKLTAEAQSEKELVQLKSDLARANAIISNVESNHSQFVSEALYKSAVEERDQLKEDNARKSAEAEKLKSEILIYRQTIGDLESENDEHVKQIEQLQEKYQQERNVLSEKLSAEQKKSAELKESTSALKEEMAQKEEEIKKLNETVKSLDEQCNKHRRAFENKCKSEEELKTALQKLQEDTGRTVEMPAPSMSPSVSPPLTPTTAAGTSPAPNDFSNNSDKLYRLQCDNDRLRGELTRVQRRAKQDAEDDDRTIVALQAQIRGKLTGDNREVYDIEVNRSKNLQKRIEELNAEIADLKKAASAVSPPVAASSTATTDTATQEKLKRLKEENESLKRHIEELEEQLGEQDGKGNDNQTPRDAAAGDGEKPKKKVKKIKKKKTLAEQVENDSIAVPPTPRSPRKEGNADTSSEVQSLRKENEALKKENAELLESVEKLNDELDQVYKDLDGAENNHQEYNRRISVLEDFEREKSDYLSQTASTNVSFSRQNLQGVEMQLRCAKDENERLLLELRELKSTAVGSEAASELKQLRKQIRQKDAEIRALSDQLLPAKQKLVEYMAMADRLGLSYPFPSELEGATVMRLRSLQKGNKTTAPSEHSSPPPPKTTKTKSKRTRKVEFPDEDDLR